MSSATHYICIHGHFYQPPRENAWLEEIESQESAAPYHDWNERINVECYYPNSVSRILNGEGKIVDIVNNYSKISFNFGPTLMSWLREHARDTYQAVIEGDRDSIRRYGYGSAMAQVYNHIIMPLANRRDKVTQVRWGIADFEYHFGRKPEGMWLAETAVDTETLEVLAEHNITFTVLAPRQARCFKSITGDEWYEGINSNLHYLCRLPSGKSITLFFYDGELAEDVAFKGILKDGQMFAKRLVSRFQEELDAPQLVHVATDGESYGHHHLHGDMALAYCLDYIEKNNLAKLTNYSAFMHRFPAQYEVEIYDNSSWSCVHGVERWRSNCGCHTGGGENWHQLWRAPLREALDWLRDEMVQIYETELGWYNPDVWLLRDEYISVILDRRRERMREFLRRHIPVELSEMKQSHVLRLLEMQRQALLMYTSCGWFFNEISGIETVQILQYANRAIQLANRICGKDLEPQFRAILEKAPSNIAEEQNGNQIYGKYTTPARLTLTKVGMHYAIASLFAEDIEAIKVFSYHAENEYLERLEAGIQKIAIGRTTVFSDVTLSRKYFSFVVLYLGQHQIIGSFSEEMPGRSFWAMSEAVRAAFNASDLSLVLQLMQNYFPSQNFSISGLFKDEKIEVLSKILKESVEQAEVSYQKIFERDYNILNLMQNEHLPIPKALRSNLEVVIYQAIESFLEDKSLDTKRLQHLANEVAKWQVPLDIPKLTMLSSARLGELARQFSDNPSQVVLLRRIREIIIALHQIGVSPNLNQVQTVLFKISQYILEQWQLELPQNPTRQRDWDNFFRLCELANLEIRVPKPATAPSSVDIG